MPNYEYRCAKCQKKFELIRSIAKRDDPTVCPHCKATKAVRAQVNRIAIMQGVRPDAYAGEGEPEDFLDGADDHFDF
jgi:putative FmdB family regulatory protein